MTNYNLPHRLRQFAAEAMYIFEGDRVLVRDAADELERLERVRNECWDAMNAFGVATGSFADFIASLKEQFDKRGTLTENQKAALLKSADRARDRR